MARRLFVNALARDDLQLIFDYGVERFGQIQAALFLDKFYDAFSLLCEFDVGVACFDIQPNLYRYVVQGYVIFFERTSSALNVLRVLHGSQDVEKQFS
ncbi:type II toxin-antitoxin system RelE/ParE family toxin [Haemophilus influenzae]|uniref:type II toxin-antitoxin system RelE/ParE family toxin n=1 Tax=Haemophilus influenzae TaxID=727 RepID=UPI001EF9A876|nr:type II toxin-antitoxin system RelE/ParE family toxin [Haemophilus influenzae]